MKRVLVLLVLVVAAPSVRADDPQPAAAPTKDQLDAAKKAFDEGKALFDSGKLAEALAKFKESYGLSKNPFLLYNIAHTYDQQGEKAKALFYYQKFLAAAPANAPPRDEVTKRVDALQKEGVQPVSDEAPAEPVAPPVPAIELVHKPIDSVPPGLPVDVAASLPPGAGALTVTLYYRAAGEETFAQKPMEARGGELVARVPADKIVGTTFQYYIDARDAAGKVVARSGKATVPNVVAIETGAKPHYTAEPGETITPLAPPPNAGHHTPGGNDQPEEHENAFLKAALTPKWIATGATGVLLATSITMYMLGSKQHDNIASDSTSCGTPPCRTYDSYDQPFADSGNRYNTLYRVSLGFTIVAAGAAGYFWYRDLTSDKPSKWAVAPSVGDHYAGAAAAARF